MAEDINKQEEVIAEAIRRKKEGRELLQEHVDALEKINVKKAKAAQLTKGQADLLEDIRSQEAKIVALQKEGEELDIKELARAKEKLEATRKLSNAINDAATQGALFADKVAPISNSFSRAAVASLEAGEGVKGLGAAFGAYALNAAKGLSLSKALFSTVERLVEDNIKTMEALDEIEASFVRATGASREFATEAFELRFALSAVGVSGEQAVGTMESLYSNMSEFSQLSKTSRNDFNELAVMIDHLGGNAAGMGQTLTKVAGMSISQTSATMTRLYGVAESLGIPFSQISDDVQAMGELFAKMGDGALDVFLELQAAAKATGMSVQSLYNIVGQYDTFEASSQAAGRLNMVLGGNLLDTYSLLNATEEERIELLQRAMEQSSMTFDEMDRFQKMEVSDALGISLEEAAQLFGTTRGEVEKTAAELLYAGMTQEELEEKVKAGTTAMEKLGLVMQNLAIAAEPLVNIIQFLADVFLGFTEILQNVFGEKFGGFIAAALALGIGLGSLVLVGKLVMGTFGGVGASAAGAAASISTAAASMTTAAAAMRAAATAISQAAPALGAVGPAVTPAIPAVLAFAGAVALVGAGVGFAAAGFALLVMQFKEMSAEEILATSAAILAVGASVAALAGALYLMGNPLALAGLGVLFAATGVLAMIGLVLSTTVGGIIGSVNELDETKASSFAAVLSSLAQLALMSLTDTGVPEYIAAVGKALDELPDETDKAIAFRTTTDSLANLMQIASTVEAEQVARIETIIGAVSNSEGNESTNQLVAAISRLVRGQASNEGTTNVIELDGRKLASWIDNHESSRFKLAIGR